MVEIIEKLKEQVTVQELCAILNVPRSTYYRWRQESKRIQGAYQLEKSVGELCKANKYRYGYRKITAILRQDRVVNHKAVQRIMQKYGWQCRVKVKKRKQTGQPYYVANNLMNREFTSQKRLEKLVTDITYLPFGGKTLYLSSILDLFNGEIIAYTISDTQNVNLVLDTLQQLPVLPQGCLLHSDQGSVYTSAAYQQAIKGKGIIMSMSRKGTPADNAPIESFHATLKAETFYLDGLTRTTTAIVDQTVRDYINYYNNTRIQLKLNNQSPINYRKLVG